MTMTEDAGSLRTLLSGSLLHPGDDGYARATKPRNATADQRPAAVAAVRDGGDVASCLRWVGSPQARDAGVRHVVVQASGHGAAGAIGEDTLLIDTSRLNRVEIDPQQRVVRAGAGATLGAINAAAWEHGLLAPAGTAPDVAVTGYTGWGGVGWLTRPHGLASAALRSVDLVDAAGTAVHADDDSGQDALWAYRGGGGVGIATRLELQLFPAVDLWAGYLLWPAEQAGDVVPAWASALAEAHPALSSAMGVLVHAPDAPTVPEQLRGHAVLHLSAASVAGEDAIASLREALRNAPRPAIDTLGPSDAGRLSTIHLDPPTPVPALGVGRWLTADAADRALAIITAGADADSPLGEIELRHVAHAPSTVEGALTSTPGPLLLHATGAAADPDAVERTEQALEAVLTVAAPVDTGRDAAAFRDGRLAAHTALDPAARTRLLQVQHRMDPDRILRPARDLTT